MRTYIDKTSGEEKLSVSISKGEVDELIDWINIASLELAQSAVVAEFMEKLTNFRKE